MPAWLNWVSQWIYTQFEGGVKFNPPWSNLTGQIGCKSIEIMTTKFDRAGIQCNLNDLHPIQIRPVEFDQHLSQWIYSKFDRAGIQCNLNDLHPIRIQLVEFNRALITGQIG